jgi:hypothetical protein
MSQVVPKFIRGWIFCSSSVCLINEPISSRANSSRIRAYSQVALLTYSPSCRKVFVGLLMWEPFFHCNRLEKEKKGTISDK